MAEKPLDVSALLSEFQQTALAFQKAMTRWEALVSLLIEKGVLTEDELQVRIQQQEVHEQSVLDSLRQKPS